MHPETRLIHLKAPVPQGSTPLAVPIYQTSSFAFDDPELIADGLHHPDRAYAYSRFANPTVRALENAITDLEGGAAAIATSSGMGAITLLLHGLLSAGDHVIVQRDVYGGTHAQLGDLAARFGIEVTRIGGHDPAELRAALTPRTRVLYLETIANPTGHVSDLPTLAPIARDAGVLTVVDNTFASPIFCRPIEHGADVVVHSVTKFLGGHSDVTGGLAVFADRALYERVWEQSVEFGATADPFAAWLTLRGLHTLGLRMDRHAANTARVATWLAAHPAVEAVRWTGDPSHPSHAVASRFVQGFTGAFCFDLDGGHDAGVRLMSRLTVIRAAASLGSTQSLILHPASTTHRQLTPDQLRESHLSPGTVRIAIGIEHPDDLVADLEQALG
ncbi:cystathionine gamma-synthase [Actinoplanes sp. SE50]|uniref:trans-sulfuration enzyme family protein n=1 Tax=unclassified Actinoplanes TaxID=2626549 RepID=UPI00023EC57C|nr:MULTISPECIES: aminotransferase class I/II-fold pyridoxal phosphate-dependent enzyme [unclassified Actinoplanes]AEV81935.1 methionine-gamma-lyase [Actinoplanes sp. SE50/110]ATO80335.1 cystathionine gamma-synthase [Actinoplanes sp. SE50]SLL97741.1 cystathionine gamma-synthase [Actinoplanes sp. SE50/110]